MATYETTRLKPEDPSWHNKYCPTKCQLSDPPSFNYLNNNESKAQIVQLPLLIHLIVFSAVILRTWRVLIVDDLLIFRKLRIPRRTSCGWTCRIWPCSILTHSWQSGCATQMLWLLSGELQISLSDSGFGHGRYESPVTGENMVTWCSCVESAVLKKGPTWNCDRHLENGNIMTCMTDRII